ncbi:MAG: restriction endonuclease subunit S, partial [Chloroflexi bacterium]|nr:restriction endonuclease subunit S [Chloroflexota bacterium]
CRRTRFSSQGYISHADQFVTKKALKECHLPRVAPLSVLVAITGQGKTRGTAALLGFEATINQHIAYITPTRNIVSPEFLQLSILGAYKELRAISDDSGSTKGALTCEDLKHFQVALPSTDEQQALVAIIRSEVADTERTIAQWERQIALMREYRTRLIADVVTGKLDVRDAAAGLREEIEAKIVSELSEAESVDETGSNASEHDIPLNDE